MLSDRFRTSLRRLTSAAVIAIAAATFSLQAQAVLITFNEVGAPIGDLTGTTFYQSLNIQDFQNSNRFGPDGRLPDDGFGITNAPGTVAGIDFLQTVTNLSLTWATSGGGISFFADAFDLANNLIDSFFFDGAGSLSSQSGVASLTGTGIARLEFHDGLAQVAIDTLSFDVAAVPEPGTLAILALGLVGIGAAHRARAKS